MDYFSGEKRIVDPEYSSKTQETSPLIAQETFILPQNVKNLALTETQNHITGRALVMITGENQVYSIKDAFYSPRRPYPPKEEDPWQKMMEELKEDPDKQKPILLKSELFPKYEPVIPIMWKRYLSYDLKLVNMKEALTFPTRLESTTQVFVHGHDLFLSRMMPDNGYDLLDEDFSYLALFAFIMALIVIDIILTKMQKKRNDARTFLTR